MEMKDLIYVRDTPDKGFGVFAIRDIKKNEIITRFTGPFLRIDDMDGFPREVWDHLLNVGFNEYVIPKDPGARVNHSCDPNAGIIQDIQLIAMRDIGKDEEVTFDYSITIVDGWTLDCKCGSPLCRGTIKPYRELPAELKRKYADYTPGWIKTT